VDFHHVVHSNRGYCHVCEQWVEGAGPWCVLYVRDRKRVCRPLVDGTIRTLEASNQMETANRLRKIARTIWPDYPAAVDEGSRPA
jgi:hypothetical protein